MKPIIKKVWEMTNAGKSLSEIRDAIRRCTTEVVAMYEIAHREIKGVPGPLQDFCKLTRRAQKALLNFYQDNVPSKEKVKLDVKKRTLNINRMRQVGKLTVKEILSWAEVQEICPCCGQKINLP